jgi:Kef-type K+ transport system membrane component KefB
VTGLYFFGYRAKAKVKQQILAARAPCHRIFLAPPRPVWFNPCDMTGAELSVAFFLQMAVILATCRIVGWLARCVGQPQVVGEMIAGVLLGPSLLGLLFPKWQHLIFPPDSLKVLFVGAQLGVGLYMFLVGVEFRIDLFRTRLKSAISVASAGMVVPFLLAGALAGWLLKQPALFSPRATWFEAFLFLGAAIAITAFPMLARIIYERGLTGTSLGALALSAGAINDAGAWCVLAIVLASFGGGAAIAFRAIGSGIAYALVVLLIGRPLLAKLAPGVERAGKMSNSMLGFVLMLLMLGAWAMDGAGIHPVFGGFLLGAAMPRGLFAKELQQKIEPFAVVFLLPMFFTFSGLNTRLDVMGSSGLLFVAVIILLASTLGKGVACWAAARVSGEDNRTALAVGTLMNARGLMELIIVNIGLARGVIQPALFSMLVLMAIITTLLASPVFELVYGRHARKSGELGAVPLGA